MQLLNSIAIKALSSLKAVNDKFTEKEDGASSVEWVLIVAGIAAVIGLIIGVVNTWWSGESTKIFK